MLQSMGSQRVGHDLVTKPPPPLISERCPGPTSGPVNQNFLRWNPRQVYNEKPPLFVLMLICSVQFSSVQFSRSVVSDSL